MRVLAAISALIALTGPSLAADYLRGSQVEEPTYSPVPTFTWAGVYGGVFAGITGANFDPRRQSIELETEGLRALPVRTNLEGLIRFDKMSEQGPSYGAFFGYNWQYEDVVFGIEGEFSHGSLSASQTRRRALSFDNLFPPASPTTIGFEPSGTFTDTVSTGTTADSVGNQMFLKARAGYAWGRFLPYLSIGGGAARVSTAAAYTVTYDTYERINNFQVITTVDPITGVPTYTRGPFIGQTSNYMPGASGTGVAVYHKNSYVPALALGFGVDWAPLDNVLIRADLQSVFLANFRGVDVSTYTARLGAGLKF